VVGLIATASPAFAKDKKSKKGKANVQAEAPAKEEIKSSGSVDDLMGDATKKSAIRSDSKSGSDSESSSGSSSTAERSGEPDAWERPPMEEEKPKKKESPIAVAEKKGDGRNIEVALTAGWATQTSKFFSVDPYGFGFGLRGAYELESHLVLGVGAEYFIGNSGLGADKAGTSTSGLVTTSANYFLANAELGYNLWFSEDAFLRPSIWAGLSFGTQNPPMLSGTSGVITAFSLSPGLTLEYIMGRTGWFIGADARINLILGQGNSGVLLHGMLGKRF
jgi:hypothetical protein